MLACWLACLLVWFYAQWRECGDHFFPAKVDFPYLEVGVPDPVDFGDFESLSDFEGLCFIDFSIFILLTELQTGEFSSPTSQFSSYSSSPRSLRSSLPPNYDVL